MGGAWGVVLVEHPPSLPPLSRHRLGRGPAQFPLCQGQGRPAGDRWALPGPGEIDAKCWGNLTFLGLQGLRLPPMAPVRARHSQVRHHQLGLGRPRSSSDTELELLLMLLEWRKQEERRPEVAKMSKAKKAARSQVHKLPGRKEPQAGQFAGPVHLDPRAIHWDLPTSLLRSPDSWSFRVGRPVGFLKSLHHGLGHVGLGASPKAA